MIMRMNAVTRSIDEIPDAMIIMSGLISNWPSSSEATFKESMSSMMVSMGVLSLRFLSVNVWCFMDMLVM